VSQLSDPLRAEALALLGKGRKIEAVKRVREETGLSLKESKDVVDWLEAGQTL
jgi:ribosomal protein L7/L12